MTLDKNKKYRVGEVVFHITHSICDQWRGRTHGGAVIDTTGEGLLALNPVEVEKPLEWDFDSNGLNFMKDVECKYPTNLHIGTWHHKVVSTRVK